MGPLSLLPCSLLQLTYAFLPSREAIRTRRVCALWKQALEAPNGNAFWAVHIWDARFNHSLSRRVPFLPLLVEERLTRLRIEDRQFLVHKPKRLKELIYNSSGTSELLRILEASASTLERVKLGIYGSVEQCFLVSLFWKLSQLPRLRFLQVITISYIPSWPWNKKPSFFMDSLCDLRFSNCLPKEHFLEEILRADLALERLEIPASRGNLETLASVLSSRGRLHRSLRYLKLSVSPGEVVTNEKCKDLYRILAQCEKIEALAWDVDRVFDSKEIEECPSSQEDADFPALARLDLRDSTDTFWLSNAARFPAGKGWSSRIRSLSVYSEQLCMLSGKHWRALERITVSWSSTHLRSECLPVQRPEFKQLVAAFPSVRIFNNSECFLDKRDWITV